MAGTRRPSGNHAASRQVETYDPNSMPSHANMGIATLGELEQVASSPDEMMIKIDSNRQPDPKRW